GGIDKRRTTASLADHDYPLLSGTPLCYAPFPCNAENSFALAPLAQPPWLRPDGMPMLLPSQPPRIGSGLRSRPTVPQRNGSGCSEPCGKTECAQFSRKFTTGG